MQINNNPIFLEKVPVKDRKKWAEALRSGKYKQARGRLCYKGSYCCLAVWEKIHGKTDFDLGAGYIPSGRLGPKVTPLSNGYLPENILFPESHLAFQLNDVLKLSFREIAELLDPTD